MQEQQIEGGGVSHRDRADELSALLSGAPFLVGLAPEIVAEVAAACELLQIAGDSQLVGRDAQSDTLYVVVHGGLRTVSRDPLGRERVVFESFRGESFGLVGLLGGVSVAVDVYAIRDSVLLRLTRARFATLAARHPELVARLAEGVARRGLELIEHQPEWTTWSRPGSSKKNLALLLPTSDRYFAGAASELARAALERYRRVAHVSRDVVDEALGRGAAVVPPSDPLAGRLLAFLQMLETRSDIVLYECDTRSPEWTARCLRQADRVVAVLRADRPEHIAELRPILERTLRRHQGPRLDVALVDAEHAEMPTSTAGWAWLEGRARIHHVRMADRRGYERLARTLVGRAIGLVLSGGGARGIAHVGVLKALEEAGVPVDHIAGTSMGAILAAACACGWSADTLMGRIRELFRRRTALYDPTLPFESLLAGHKLERVLRSYFEGFDIEGLWLPFFCVSTDLTRAELHVHQRGELWRAVAASCSIPGIFPPRHENGSLLVDGGVVANLPIAAMVQRLDGAIIASDVNLYGNVTPDPHPPSTAARLLDFARWVNPLSSGGTSPEIFEVLLRSALVGSHRAELSSLRRGEVSLYLPLPVERFRVLEWGEYEALYRIGYEFSSKLLATWRPPWQDVPAETKDESH